MREAPPKVTERELRLGLKDWLLNRVRATDLIVEELGVEHGDARIDVAVAGSSLDGYEIKSDFDTLDRLANQMHAYHRVFDSLTVATTPVFAKHVTLLLPIWWGILVATRNSEGHVLLTLQRAATRNPRQDMRSLVALLWRDEAASLLGARSDQRFSLSANRARLYDLLTERVEPSTLHSDVIATLQRRTSLRLRDLRRTRSTDANDGSSEPSDDWQRLVAT